MFGFRREFTIRIFRELNNGNTGRSKHWSSAHRERNAWRRAVQAAVVIPDNEPEIAYLDYVTKPPDEKIGLIIRRVLGAKQRLWDADSILRGSAKEMIDSLVESNLAKDDNTKYVAWVMGDQDSSRREIGPFTEVEVWKT